MGIGTVMGVLGVKYGLQEVFVVVFRSSMVVHSPHYVPPYRVGICGGMEVVLWWSQENILVVVMGVLW